MKMLESSIERKVKSYARTRGWLAYKWVSPSNRGVPDGIFIRHGKMFFIEFKAPDKKVTKLQKKHITDLQRHGFKCYIVSDVEYGKSIVDMRDD